ncbi:MAG: hypothetical protein ABSH20_10525 [Tepidisphaeraceae bacterium]|jgi:hypothetical protein
MDFLKNFRIGSSPASLLDADIRRRLQEFIIAGDAAGFRQALQTYCPDLQGQHRYYGVVQRIEGQMSVILVDETGRVLASDDVMPADSPTNILNTEFTATGIRVTIGDDVWHAPIR